MVDRLLEQHRLMLTEQREHMEAMLARRAAELTPKPAIASDDVTSLQRRLGAMHTAELLSDAELYVLEDIISDFLELRSSVAAVLTQEMIVSSKVDYLAAARTHTMIGVSQGVPADASFARQLKRKFVV